MKRISPLVFVVPLFIVACLVAGAFVYKNMLAPSRAAETKQPEVVKEYIKFKAAQNTKKVSGGFGSVASDSGNPSGLGRISPIPTPMSLTGILNQIPSATSDSELQDIEKDINSL